MDIIELSDPSKAPYLWQNVAYGMSPEEVRRAQPDAIPANDESVLGDGTPCALLIPELHLLGRPYVVHFYFKFGGLVQVTISALSNPQISDFTELVRTLRAKYGREGDCEIGEDNFSFSTANWVTANGVNIALVCFPASELLNINFQMRVAEAAARL